MSKASKEYYRAYYRKHKEKIREMQKLYYKQNRETILEKKKHQYCLGTYELFGGKNDA